MNASNASPDPSFWRGRRVFLTGHTGFKGSWLSLWLDALGADVTGFALAPPTTPALYEQANVAATLRSVIGDVRDGDRLERALRAARPEVVLHLAAQSVVKTGYADPAGTYATNVMGTVHLLDAVRKMGGTCVVVNVTSDKCYAVRADGRPYQEDDPMGGDDPYANSKGCAELVAGAFRTSYFGTDGGPAVASARAGNAIGGGDWTPHQLIPDLMRAFAGGTACPIRNPAGVRPWQFVLEPLRGYLVLAERLASDGPSVAAGWNFGPQQDDARPVAWIADRLAATWGDGATWERDEGAHPHESPTLRLATDRARTHLGWRPAVALEETLDLIVEWYRGWRDAGDLAALTRDQLVRYVKRFASEGVTTS